MILDLNMKPGLPPNDHQGEVLIKHRDYGWMIGHYHAGRLGAGYGGCWGGMGFNHTLDMAQGILFIEDQVDNAIGWVAIHSDN